MAFIYLVRMLGKFNTDDSGVSPVIGVILLVAVTVALVALATVIVFDIGSDVSDTADATVDTNVDVSDETISASVVRSENVDSFELQAPNGDEDDPATDDVSDVGETMTLDGDDIEESGTASVVVTLEDGTDEVLTTFDYDFTNDDD